MEEPESINKIGINARKHVTEIYDQNKITKKLIEFCEKL